MYTNSLHFVRSGNFGEDGEKGVWNESVDPCQNVGDTLITPLILLFCRILTLSRIMITSRAYFSRADMQGTFR